MPLLQDGRESSSMATQVLARTLRHEVGDFLQSVYAIAALLRDRLPEGMNQERNLLAHLRGRAEECRLILDGVHALVLPQENDGPTTFDMADLSRSLVAAAAARFPVGRFEIASDTQMPVEANIQLLKQAAQLLLFHTGRVALQKAMVNTAATGPTEGAWSITRDGPAADADALRWRDQPFATTHDISLGLGLHLAHVAVNRAGGRVEATNLAEGGFRVRVVMPRAPDK